MLLLLNIVTYIKENIITKLQKLYSPPRNPRAGNKLPVLFVKKPLCTGNLLPASKIFIERPGGPVILSVTYYLWWYKFENLNADEKNTWIYYHFTQVTINDSHMTYGSWDMKHVRQNFLSFWERCQRIEINDPLGWACWTPVGNTAVKLTWRKF